MGFIDAIKKIWQFLKEDSWQSWIVSIILIIIVIKFIFFPVLSFTTGTNLPLVVVESCSMYHESDFDSWWQQNSPLYESRGIVKADFEKYPFKEGINKGDIIFVLGKREYKTGDVIIFSAPTKYPIIHRVISLEPLSTKGDHNPGQIEGIETNIAKDSVIGKAVFRIPGLGWVKLIFFEPLKKPEDRGFCR